MSTERKISQLPSREQVTGTEYFLVGFNGRSYKMTLNELIATFNNGVNLDVLNEIRAKFEELQAIGTPVTTEQLAQAIAEIPSVDLSAYATTELLKQAINEAISSIPSVDLTTYALKEELPDVSGFLTTEDLPAAPDLSAYYTKLEVDQKLLDIPSVQPVDLSPYALKTEIPVIPDLSSYALKSEIPVIPDLSQYALKSEIPAEVDHSQFLTAEDLPEAPDMSGYALKSELPEVPDVSEFMTATQVQQAVTEALLATNDFVRVSENPIGRILWVSGQEIQTQDGSLAAPFATIQQAVDRAANDNAAWTIICLPGSGNGYTNDVTISGKSNILIQGWGAQGAHNVVIKGTVTITGSATTRIRLRDIGIRPLAGNPAIVLDGTAGRHYFQNVNPEPAAGYTGPLVVYRNGEQRWSSWDQCDLSGRVVIEDTVNANLAVYFNNQNSLGCHLEINGGSNFYLRNCQQFGSVEHNAGNFEAKYCGVWAGKNGVAVQSTTTDKLCYLAFCDFINGNNSTSYAGDNVVTAYCNAAG